MTILPIHASSHTHYAAAWELRRWARDALPRNPRRAARLYAEAVAKELEGDARLRAELRGSLRRTKR